MWNFYQRACVCLRILDAGHSTIHTKRSARVETHARVIDDEAWKRAQSNPLAIELFYTQLSPLTFQFINNTVIFW